MRLTINKESDNCRKIFYKNGTWYGYAEYKTLTGHNIIRGYNDDLITYGYFENGHTKIFYI